MILRSVADLAGYAIHAKDGEIGRIVDCLFDDEKWTIRYLNVYTGGWLVGRKVLISPIAVREINWKSRYVRVNLTRVQVENSPDIDTQQPVSRALEARYFRYYSWPYYWTGAGIWGAAAVPDSAVELPSWRFARDPLDLYTLDSASPTEMDTSLEVNKESHLRSAYEVLGYRIEALDSHFGRVTDFLFDDRSWAFHYLVVQTRHWFSSTSVLLETSAVDWVEWTHRRIRVPLTRSQMNENRKIAA